MQGALPINIVFRSNCHLQSSDIINAQYTLALLGLGMVTKMSNILDLSKQSEEIWQKEKGVCSIFSTFSGLSYICFFRHHIEQALLLRNNELYGSRQSAHAVRTSIRGICHGLLTSTKSEQRANRQV